MRATNSRHRRFDMRQSVQALVCVVVVGVRLDAAGSIDLPRPEGDPLRAAALPLPPLPLPRRGGGQLGPPLRRLVGLDLLLPAILAAERGVAPAHPRAPISNQNDGAPRKFITFR